MTKTDETGWLIEEDGGSFTVWIALSDERWPQSQRVGINDFYEARKYSSPVRRVKDTGEALRLARREDAEAFIKLFDRFLLHAKATEHKWPTAPAFRSASFYPLPDNVADLGDRFREGGSE